MARSSPPSELGSSDWAAQSPWVNRVQSISMNVRLNQKINPALLSVQLLGLWSRISQVHLGLGASCQCAGEIPGVAVSDLELNILEYLHGKYQHDAQFTAWLSLEPNEPSVMKSSLTALLKAMATQTPERALALRVLQDLQRTLESLQQAHLG